VTLTVSPSLNWPAFVRIDEILTVNYGSLPVAQVEWTLSQWRASLRPGRCRVESKCPRDSQLSHHQRRDDSGAAGIDAGTYQATVKFLDASGLF